MKHYISLSDNDIFSMDDATGNIVVTRSNLPHDINIGEEVYVSYKEDPENISHVYSVSRVDTDKVSLNWIKQLGESLLKESPVIKLDDSEIMNPKTIDFKDKAEKAVEQERIAAETEAKNKREQVLKNKFESIAEVISSGLKYGDTPNEIIDSIFDDLVPPSGPAATVAGELLRAIMRILYRDNNDGDKFFEGYGIETCASSAEYLMDMGLEKDINSMLERAHTLSDDDDKYTEELTVLAKHVLEKIAQDPKLLWTENTTDSREYPANYIVENQPTYEFELYGSAEVESLVDSGVLNSWDLIKYVEGQLEYEPAYRDAEVDRPWSHHDASVTVSNLTRDGYELLKSNFEHNPDAWWNDLVSEYMEDIEPEED